MATKGGSIDFNFLGPLLYPAAGSATAHPQVVSRRGTNALVGMSKGDGYSPSWRWVSLGGWVLAPPLQMHGTWDTAGYGRQMGGMHPTGTLSCFYVLYLAIAPSLSRYILCMVKNLYKRLTLKDCRRFNVSFS